MGLLIQIHSFLRWIVLILLLTAIIKSLNGMISKRAYANSDNKISLFLLISTHTQLLVGIVLYFISSKVIFDPGVWKSNNIARFFTMEHSVMMLIAVALITIGHVSRKKASTDAAKFKRAFWFFLIAFLVIFAAIPWPFMQVAKDAVIGWF